LENHGPETIFTQKKEMVDAEKSRARKPRGGVTGETKKGGKGWNTNTGGKQPKPRREAKVVKARKGKSRTVLAKPRGKNRQPKTRL